MQTNARIPRAAADADNAPALYHLHIPKTAGTTVREVVSGWFRPEAVCPLLSNVELLQMPREQFATFEFFSGHLEFGYYLSDLLGRPVQAVTFLREPCACLFSRYKHVRREPADPVRVYVDQNCPEIEAFFSDPCMVSYVNNPQCRFLAEGERRLTPNLQRLLRRARPDEIPALIAWAGERQSRLTPLELLTRARRRLDQCLLVGLTEQLRPSLELLAVRLQRPLLAEVPALNCSDDSRQVGELSPQVQTRLAELTTLDAQLYQEYAERLGEALAGSVHSTRALQNASR